MTSVIKVDTIQNSSGTNSITVPSNTGRLDIPVFVMKASNISQDVGAASATKAEMNTTVVDTHSMIDLTNDRVIPTVAGYYAVSGMLRVQWDSTGSYLIVGIRKNGTAITNTQIQLGSSNIENGQYPIPMTIVECNGTTDYIELWGQGSSASTFSDTTNLYDCTTLSGFLVRAT